MEGIITGILVTLEHQLHLSSPRIPELNAAIFRSGDDPFPIMRNSHGKDIVLRTKQQPIRQNTPGKRRKTTNLVSNEALRTQTTLLATFLLPIGWVHSAGGRKSCHA